MDETEGVGKPCCWPGISHAHIAAPKYFASFSPLRGSEILGDEQTTSQVSKLNTNDMRTNEMYRDRQKGLAVC